MNHQFTVAEEERVTLQLPRRVNDVLLLLFTETGQVVDELPRVSGVGDDESKFKRVLANHSSLEIVSLNHEHLVNGLLANAERQCQADSLQLQEVGSQVILHHASGWIVVVGEILIIHFAFLNLYESDVRYHVTDFEATEAEIGPVVGKFAEEARGRVGQGTHVFWRHVLGLSRLHTDEYISFKLLI